MDQAFAYSTLALTVGLAVSRPRLGLCDVRVTPGLAALIGVALLALARVLTFDDLVAAARVQWRPLITLSAILFMTGVVQELRTFERFARMVEARAAAATPARVFTIVFALAVVTPALLNNDAAILLLTPVVVPLARRIRPSNAAFVDALAFAVFLAPGVAPFVVSNPMNLIVAELGGIGFNEYAKVMAPIALFGALLTYVVLRVIFRRALAREARAADVDAHAEPAIPRHPAERKAFAVLAAVFVAYPIAAAFALPIWIVATAGALALFVLARRHRVATTSRLASHVSIDVLVFLWGVFLIVAGLRNVGVVAMLADVFRAAPPSSGRAVATVGTIAALGSAVVDNHPMALLDLSALGASHPRLLLAALVGGDVGPRLLPIGSLAGLLWMDLLRRRGAPIGVGKFVRIGTLVLLPTLTLSLVLLHAWAK